MPPVRKVSGEPYNFQQEEILEVQFEVQINTKSQPTQLGKAIVRVDVPEGILETLDITSALNTAIFSAWLSLKKLQEESNAQAAATENATQLAFEQLWQTELGCIPPSTLTPNYIAKEFYDE